jgi:hypothetical protein
MIKNFKDIVVLLITTGVLILLATIIIGDYIVALEENRPVDESVITLMKMSVTGSNRRNRRLCWWKQITEYCRLHNEKKNLEEI